MQINPDYAEKVYAGILGKIIGVYLGRPFEGWLFNRIIKELGEINYYVNEKLGVPLIVTDDDISGTFTFLRALQDYAHLSEITPEKIGDTWLNYLIEKKTVLWWGGLGNSTEHTAYLRLKHGIKAPLSGSERMNGKVVSEQIGAQIFIDGWAMVSPGDPERAADYARRAASVSHDGEAIFGAQVLAAMEAQAFVEKDILKLIDVGISMIPRDSIIYSMISDLREWQSELNNWRDARKNLERFYGYDKYGGNCHMVPNHGLIILGLLYGEDNFQKTLMITNTSGWDTDCNSGNVGCLMGIKNGLAGIDAGPDWRGPIHDQLYLPTADGGSCITDAVTETYKIVNITRSFANLPKLMPKDGARYHFSFPGSVQGFQTIERRNQNCSIAINNVISETDTNSRWLAIQIKGSAANWQGEIAVPTFVPPKDMNMQGYSLYASPTIYPGQSIDADLIAADFNGNSIHCRIYVEFYGEKDELFKCFGPEKDLEPGEKWHIDWRVKLPETAPIARIGFEFRDNLITSSIVYLNRLTWTGTPDVNFSVPSWGGEAWRKAWVNAVDHFQSWGEPFRLIQDEGTGLLIQGTRDWEDYKVSADITPHMVEEAGIAVHVQGLRRYYALLLVRDSKARLVKVLDGETILDEVDFPWAFGEFHQLEIDIQGAQIKCWINSNLVFDVADNILPLTNGAVALVVKEGRSSTQKVVVTSN